MVKSQRDLSLTEEKESFAENVVDLILEAFADLSYSEHLLPQSKNIYKGDCDDASQNVSDDNDNFAFWDTIIRIAKTDTPDSKFCKLVPSKHQWNGINMNNVIKCASIGCNVTQSNCRVELVGWGDKNCAKTNFEVFDNFLTHKSEIEQEMGCPLKWDRNEDKFTTRISVSRSLSYKNADNGMVRDIADFFSEYFHKFVTILPKYCIEDQEEEWYDVDR